MISQVECGNDMEFSNMQIGVIDKIDDELDEYLLFTDSLQYGEWSILLDDKNLCASIWISDSDLDELDEDEIDEELKRSLPFDLMMKMTSEGIYELNLKAQYVGGTQRCPVTFFTIEKLKLDRTKANSHDEAFAILTEAAEKLCAYINDDVTPV